MSNVIRSLIVRVGADLTGMQKGLKQASKDLKKAGKDISSAGSSLTKGLTVPIVGAVAGLASMAVSAGKGADELITLSNKTGITTQALQEMEYAARFIDVEVETMTGSMQKLTKNMDAARDGTGAQADAFKTLKIGITNADGSLRNAKDVWAESIDALGNISSEADRDALAMQLFGKSAAELNPLIKAGSGELKRLGDEAHTVGAVMSDENVTALGKFDDQMQTLQATFKTAAGNIGAAFLPALEKIQPLIEEKVVPAIQKVAGFITDLIDGFDKLSPGMQDFVLTAIGFAVAIGPALSVIGKLTTGIGGIMSAVSAASTAFTLAGGGAAGLSAAFGALLGPAGVVLLVITAVAAAAYLIVKNWGPISEFFKNLWASVSKWFVDAGNAIKNTAVSIWTGISNFFTTTVNNIKNSVITAFTALKTGVSSIFTGIWTAIKGTINSIIGGVEGMTNGVVKGINRMISALNGLSFNIPDWVPGLGGKKFGLKLKQISTISIPRLAEGAVIRPNDEFLAMLGDQKSGVNIETPLSTMMDAFESSLDKNGTGSVTIYNPLTLDGQTLNRSSSKIQYGKNRIRARSKGMVPA